MKPRLTVITGCTACGKSSLGVELARRVGGEIVSLDSMKVYRRMDIGTAKPSSEVRREVPHHLIDVVEPWEEFSAAKYVTLADEAIQGVRGRGREVLVVGGTPLYLKALIEGMFEGPSADPDVRSRLHEAARTEGAAKLHVRLLGMDPEAAERIHPNDVRRIVRAIEVYELTGKPISHLQEQWDRERTRYDVRIVGLRRSREDQGRRINERVHRMIDAGLVDEVRTLLAEPHPLSSTARKALGYAEIIEHLAGGRGFDEAVERIKINTRQFAKSQRTWLRRFTSAAWIELEAGAEVDKVADEVMTLLEDAWSH